MFGCALNDYFDLELDKMRGTVSNRPLIKGTISKKAALAFSYGTALGVFILATLITRSLLALAVLGSSVILVWAYNSFGKNFLGGGILMPAATFSFCLFGALSVSPAMTFKTVPPIAFIVCVLFFIQVHLGYNLVYSMTHLNMNQHNARVGSNTIAIALGLKAKDGRLIMPLNFMAYVSAVQIIHIALVLWAYLELGLNVSYGGIPVWVMMLPLFVGKLYSFIRYLTLDSLDLDYIWRIRHIQEFCSYTLIPVMSLSIIGFKGALSLLLTIAVWGFTMRNVLFGHESHPFIKGYE